MTATMFESMLKPQTIVVVKATKISRQSANIEHTPADQPPIFLNLTAM